MTNFTILIDDADREKNPTAPWTATLSVGATPSHLIEAQARGATPVQAVGAMLVSTDLLRSEPEDCPDCGMVKGSQMHGHFHDEEGNCFSHRMPR